MLRLQQAGAVDTEVPFSNVYQAGVQAPFWKTFRMRITRTRTRTSAASWSTLPPPTKFLLAVLQHWLLIVTVVHASHVCFPAFVACTCKIQRDSPKASRVSRMTSQFNLEHHNNCRQE